MSFLVIVYAVIAAALGTTCLLIGLNRQLGSPMLAMTGILVSLSAVLMVARVRACVPLAWVYFFWHLIVGGIPLVATAVDDDLALDIPRAGAQTLWIIGGATIVYLAHRKEVARWLN